MKASVTPGPNTVTTRSWDLVRPSIKLLYDNFVAVMYLFIFPGLLMILGDLLFGDVTISHHFVLSHRQYIGLGLIGVSFIWNFINFGPATYFQLRTIDGKPETIGSLYRHGLRYTWRIWAYYLLAGIMITVGLILVIAPGLILLRRYLLGSYYLVDNDITIREALKRSARDSKPVSGAIWGAFGVCVALTIIANIFSIVPVLGSIVAEFATYPCLFILALRYREIRPAAA